MTADTPNKDHKDTPIELSVEQIAYSVQLTRAALDHGTNELPYEISERLRAARVRALAQAKQSTAQTEAEQNNAVADLFNWRHKLTGWFKAGVAVSAFALALSISVVSIRSEITTDVAVSDRAISMTESSSTIVADQASTEAQSAVSNDSPDTAHALVGSANTHTAKRHSTTAPHQDGRDSSRVTSNTAAAKINHADSTAATVALAAAELADQAPAPVLAAAKTADVGGSIDDDIALVLHEQIPLQAYLNDDFARFANHQGLSQIEQQSNSNNSASPEQ